MPTIKAFRMDGLGNKFVIVDRRKDIVNITKEKIIHLGNLESFHREIGFDQIIFIEREIDKAFPITIFNSDGGEVSACGNGSRCVAYLLGKDLDTKEVKLKTNNRLLNAKIVGHLDVELAMGKPIFDWNKIPLIKELDHSNMTLNIDGKAFNNGFSLNVGNPHIIFFVKDCFEHDLKILGPKIENDELFPEKTNVTFAQVDNKNNMLIVLANANPYHEQYVKPNIEELRNKAFNNEMEGKLLLSTHELPREFKQFSDFNTLDIHLGPGEIKIIEL